MIRRYVLHYKTGSYIFYVKESTTVGDFKQILVKAFLTYPQTRMEKFHPSKISFSNEQKEQYTVSDSDAISQVLPMLDIYVVENEPQKPLTSEATTNGKQEPARTASRPVEKRQVLVGVASLIGRRKTNEDAHTSILNLEEEPETSFFAVYDGHGGKDASKFCSEKMHKNAVKSKSFQTNKRKALRRAFTKTNESYMLKAKDDGCTALVALLTEKHLYVANAGDCRCVLFQNGKAVQMSKDHKPTDIEEKKRIEEADHEVTTEAILQNGKRVGTIGRVDGELSVSRAIGDFRFKDNFGQDDEKQAITCVPEITETEIQRGQFFVLACDGVWDVMSNQEVVDFLQHHLLSSNIQQAADQLVQEAFQKGSTDNITAVVVAVK